MDLVSVIVPVYNVESYLPRCIQSIQNQTYKNIEILLINDGSTDESGTVCETYALNDNRIKYFNNDNFGCSYSRNFGLKICEGKYILFVDSDDYIDADLIKISIEQIEKFDLDLFIFDILSVDDINNRKTVLSSNIPIDTVFSAKTYKNVINAVPAVYNKVSKKSLWIDNGIEFPVNVRYEDLDVIPRLLGVAKRIKYYNVKPLYFYAFRQGSFIKSEFTNKKYQEIIMAIDNVEKFYRTNGMYDYMHKEFEFFNTMHAFFYPSKELVQQKKIKSDLIEEIRENIIKKYPEFMKNGYIESLSISDKILFYLLVHRFYHLMNIMSCIRNYISKILKR